MLGELPWWVKLWYKGVDIAASILANSVSAAIIAVIATLTWRWKIRRDLSFEEDKQRQQDRVTRELERQKRRDEHRERVKTLSEDRDRFVSAILSVPSVDRLQTEWDRYLKWLTLNGLVNLPANQSILNVHANYSNKLHAFPAMAKTLSEAIRGTELPRED
jgi:chromatin segregation and condensation protein Rec8/ScpA/Scc1 (kleisin family)